MNDILKKWQKYCIEAEDLREEDYIPDEWSTFSKEIENLCERNIFFKEVTVEWSEESGKRESIDLIKILNKMCFNWFENSKTAENVLMLIEKNEDLIFRDRALKEKSSFCDFKTQEEIKQKFLEVIEFYLDKNPKFKFDW